MEMVTLVLWLPGATGRWRGQIPRHPSDPVSRRSGEVSWSEQIEIRGLMNKIGTHHVYDGIMRRS